MHQEFLLGRRLTGKPSDSRPDFLGSNPSVPANFIRKAARGGAQLVLKTRPSITSRGFDSFAFRQVMSDKLQFVIFPTKFFFRFSDKLKHVGQSAEASPNWYGSGPLSHHALRVQVQLLSPPPKHCQFSIGDCRLIPLSNNTQPAHETNRQSAIGNRQCFGTCSSAE